MSGTTPFSRILPLGLLLVLHLPAAGLASGREIPPDAVSPGFAVQVGAFANREYADQLVARLQRRHLHPSSARNAAGLLVVTAGSYATGERARAEGARLVADGAIKEFLVVPRKAGKGGRPGPGAAERAGNASSPRRPVIPASDRAETVRKGHASTTLAAPGGKEAVLVGNGTAGGETKLEQRGEPGTALATSPPEQTVLQQEQSGRIYPSAESPSLPAAAVPTRTDAEPPPEAPAAPERLARGWQLYRSGRFADAAALFASLPAKASPEAAYGLARCHLALKDPARALPEFERLVERRYRLHDTLPELLRLLLERGEYGRAASYVPLLSAKERPLWRMRIERALFMQEYARVRVRERGGAPEVAKFTVRHAAELRQCRAPSSFSDAARFLAANGRPAEAAAVYRALLACTREEGEEVALLYALKPLVQKSELLALADGKLAAAPKSQKLQAFKVELLRGLLAEGPENAERYAPALLRLRPGDRDALSALGWRHYQEGRYQLAYGCFRELASGASPSSGDLQGLVYSLMKLDRLEEALQAALRRGDDPKLAVLADEVRLKMLWKEVSATESNSPEMERLAARILELKPENEDIRVVLGWNYYNRQLYDKAYREFNLLYSRNPQGKGYAYALASTLAKQQRYQEAAELASQNKGTDSRLAPLETELYRELGSLAYRRGDYRQALISFERVAAAEPDDEEVKGLLESSRYRDTPLAKVLSPIVGLSGHSYGTLSRDLNGPFAYGASGLLQQGIDWVKLPWDTLLRTYGEVSYMERSWQPLYHNLLTYAGGVALEKGDFTLGAEYSVQRWTRQDTGNRGTSLYLGWYRDWYKYLHDESGDAGWFNINSLSGSTYGKLSQDLSGATGTTISGMVNQGVDWVVLPGDVTLNSFAEFRFSLRTREGLYYNSYGPAVGTEFQRKPFRVGVEYYWERDPDRQLVIPRASVYLRWYLWWDLKPRK